jgi:hypothetical protein
MTLRILTTDKSVVNVTKNIFEISKNFKVVSRPIFHADSKSAIRFLIRLKLNPQFKNHCKIT